MEASDTVSKSYEAVENMYKELRGNAHDDIAVYIDLQIGSYVERSACVQGTLYHERREVDDYKEMIKEGINRAFSTASEGKTLLIISGHGTGILTPTYNQQSKIWTYESDSGISPCTLYSKKLGEEFGSHIYDIMSGKSLIMAQGTRTFLSATVFSELMQYSSQLLRRKVDIVGFDACYMAMLEEAYEVKEYVRYLVASQDCEEKEGWDYGRVIQSLGQDDALQVARHIVYRYERERMSRPADRYSLSILDLSYCAALVDALDAVARLILLEQDNRLLDSVCRARVKLHHVTGLPFYVDIREFIDALWNELNEVHLTPARQKCVDLLLEVRYALGLMVNSYVAGPGCFYLKGCSIYFPTSHIDSSYRGSFVKNHLWNDLLKYVTSGKIDSLKASAQ